MDAPSENAIDRLVGELRKEIDVPLLEARLRMTPTDRLERMRRFMRFLEDLRAARGERVPEDH